MNNIRVIKMNAFEQKIFKPTKNKKIIYNGNNNEGYQYVIDRYKYSPTNATIIDSYSNFVYGGGLNENTLFKKQVLRKLIFDFVMFEECAMEIILDRTLKKIAEINYLPKAKVLPNEVDEKGVITSYHYSYDWSELRKYPSIELPIFNANNPQARSVFIIKKDSIDNFYFARPSYYASLNYASLEEEISLYCVNHIKNGLSAGHIINVNEGITDDEVKNAYEKAIERKWTGADNSNKFILSFNSNKENATTIESIEVSNAHEQYQFLTEEARKQIMVGHKVTSPILFGIKDNTGFGNNADEMQTAFEELMTMVIAPKQEVILDGLQYLADFNKMNIELKFEDLRKDKINTTQKLHKFTTDSIIAQTLIDKGEDLTDDYDCVSSADVCYDDDDKFHFASTGVARGNAKSEVDNDDYKIRYRYNGKITEKSREFCVKMINASKVYRREDIINMDSLVVNAGWGEFGTEPYSIWKFKGGGACRHNWKREIYVKKGVNVDVNSPLAELININEARRKGYNKELNDTDAFVIPNNLPNNGFLHK